MRRGAHVDIIGRGADGATVVVELKVGEARTRPSGRSPATWGWHQQHQGAGTVRGILVASDFPERVQYAARAMPNLALRRYRIQLAFEDEALRHLKAVIFFDLGNYESRKFLDNPLFVSPPQSGEKQTRPPQT